MRVALPLLALGLLVAAGYKVISKVENVHFELPSWVASGSLTESPDAGFKDDARVAVKVPVDAEVIRTDASAPDAFADSDADEIFVDAINTVPVEVFHVGNRVVLNLKASIKRWESLGWKVKEVTMGDGKKRVYLKNNNGKIFRFESYRIENSDNPTLKIVECGDEECPNF